MKRNNIITLNHPELPGSVFAGWKYLDDYAADAEDEFKRETRNGRRLIKEMINSNFDRSEFDIVTKKYEKPLILCEKPVISVSFSHTNSSICGVVSEKFVVGIDMELLSREVDSRLKVRMKHPGESDEIYNALSTIRIWTMKEAALKAIGTGLRKPMNSVMLVKISANSFSVKYDNGKQAKICSFRESDKWISICYY